MLTQDDLKAITKIVKTSEKKVVSLMIKNQNATIASFENEDTRLEKRVEKIEHKIGMTSVN